MNISYFYFIPDSKVHCHTYIQTTYEQFTYTTGYKKVLAYA